MVAVAVVAGVICLNVNNLVIPHVQSQRAAAAAVNRTGTPDDAGRVAGSLLHCRRGAAQRKGQGEAAGGQRQRTEGCGFDERASGDAAGGFLIRHCSLHDSYAVRRRAARVINRRRGER